MALKSGNSRADPDRSILLDVNPAPVRPSLRQLPPEVLDYIRTIFDYNPTTGWVSWLVHDHQPFRVGTRAGSADPKRGYRNIRFHYKGKLFQLAEHHVAYFLMLGHWPPQELDHKNRNGGDNKWENLTHDDGTPRLANASQQNQNRSIQKNNTSGIRSVYWDKQRKRWRSCITDPLTGKEKYLGSFIRKEDAADAVADFRAKHHDPRFKPD